MLFRLIQKYTPLVVLLFLAFSLFWKGGKTLEVTWVLVAVAWLCTTAYWSKRKMERDFVPPLIWLCLMLFTLWTGLSQLVSETANYGLDEVFRAGSLTLIYFWAAREWRAEAGTFRTHLFRVLTFSTLLAACIGVGVYLFQPVERFVGTFLDWRFHTDYFPNSWAEYVLLTWPLVCWWFLKQAKTRIETLLVIVCEGFLLSTFFLSFSRGALVAFVGQLLLLMLLFRLHTQTSMRAVQKARWKRTLLVSSGIALVSALLFIAINDARSTFHPVQDITDKVTFTAAEGTSSISERQQFWKQALELATERPLFGWGPYSFRFVQTRVQDAVFATSDHPHNWFLKLAAERGFVVALLILCVLLILYTPVVRSLWRQKIPKNKPPEYHIPLIVGPLGLIAHVLVDYNLQFVGIAFVFWILLGVFTATHAEGRSRLRWDHPTMRRIVCIAEVTLASLLLILAIVEGRYLILSSLGRHAEARNDIETALHWYNQARHEYFSRDLHVSRAHLQERLGEFGHAQGAIDTYLTRNMHDARAWLRKGDIATHQHNVGDAMFAYEQAFRLGKWNHLGALRGILQVLLKTKDDKTIAVWTERAQGILPHYLEAITRNTHFITLTPNVEEFLTITLYMSRIDPENAPKYEAMGAKADREAREERERMKARPVGRLW
ncbi:hypothetical protein COU77_01800 [Candidatus Peregrinibacteria bacterium CG10_big_fil_rev_8_21_14_0_10_49_16]|nr:MAG: hypothetical protein COW95_03765 [Candidatus Peregrinibacteria bacterium CG22_combo_CG10-13_8_21_14_all_49_11]PIR52175.1 MAG: hypothetical protein COU77_01800 [Candidatus Peregrinibacteria bacterium CG10_big_fil_rev_8_21_14_0_10_49_16]